MPVTDAELHLIFRYLDHELSDVEEQALLQQMQQNPELQKAFDQQILLSEFLSKENEAGLSSPVIESADNYVARMNQLAGSSTNTTPVALPIPKRRWQPLAAAAIAAIVLTATLYFFTNQRDTPPGVVKVPERKTASFTKDSVVLMPDTTRLLADNNAPVQLSDDYYTVFPKNILDVPPAATQYQWKYEHKHYEEVAVMDENVVITKGQSSPGEQQDIINYFNFYKALSNIQISKTNVAESLLTDLIVKNHGNSQLNRHVRWYLLMAYLKSNNRKDALLIAKSIASDQSSPYHTKAAEIQARLTR